MAKIAFSQATTLPVITVPRVGARFTEFEFKDSANGRYISLVFTVTEEPHQGRKLFRNASLLPQSLWATKRTLIALGADEEAIAEDMEEEELQDLVGALLGAPCTLGVKVKKYEGEDRNEVTRVSAPSDVSSLL